MILGHDYVYDMKYVVSTLFRVMYFPHNEIIAIVYQLAFVDPSSYLIVYQVFPLLIPSVSVDTDLPQVNYVASYPSCPIATKKKPLHSCLYSWDSIPTVD